MGDLPAKFGAISTMLAIAPAYAAVISVTAMNHTIKTRTISQPRYPININIIPGTTCAVKQKNSNVRQIYNKETKDFYAIPYICENNLKSKNFVSSILILRGINFYSKENSTI